MTDDSLYIGWQVHYGIWLYPRIQVTHESICNPLVIAYRMNKHNSLMFGIEH